MHATEQRSPQVIEVHKLTQDELGYPLVDFSNLQERARYIDWAKETVSNCPYIDHQLSSGRYPYVVREYLISDRQQAFSQGQGAIIGNKHQLRAVEQLERRVLTPDTPEYVFFGPHSDDDELTAMFLKQQYRLQGYRVSTLLFTAGSAGKTKIGLDEVDCQIVRVAEAMRGAGITGTDSLYVPLRLNDSGQIQRYGFREWFWNEEEDEIHGGIHHEALAVALRTVINPTVIVAPHPEYDKNHIDHRHVALIAKFMFEQAPSGSNYQKTWSGTPPCKELYWYSVFYGGFPKPDVIVPAPLNSNLARLKEVAMNAFQCQNASVYGETVVAMNLAAGQKANVGQWNKPPILQEDFLYQSGVRVLQLEDEIPPRVDF